MSLISQAQDQKQHRTITQSAQLGEGDRRPLVYRNREDPVHEHTPEAEEHRDGDLARLEEEEDEPHDLREAERDDEDVGVGRHANVGALRDGRARARDDKELVALLHIAHHMENMSNKIHNRRTMMHDETYRKG